MQRKQSSCPRLQLMASAYWAPRRSHGLPPWLKSKAPHCSPHHLRVSPPSLIQTPPSRCHPVQSSRGGLVGGVSVGGSIGPSGTSSFSSASTESKVAASVEKILYVLSALFALIFGVLMAIYRFHLTEISRSEQYKLGLHRIRIAANNHNHAGFNTEVRAALTLGAFEFSTGKEKKVESPLPGHPASDLATALTNKLLDAIEIKVTPKKE